MASPALSQLMYEGSSRDDVLTDLVHTATSGAGVFSTGTTTWVCELTASCLQDPRPHPDLTVLQVTKNLLLAFGAGPAGQAHPSKPNVTALHIDNPKK